MKSKRHNSGHSFDRKTAQLCAQVERALHFIVPELFIESQFDPTVVGVKPAPNASHLMVLVAIDATEFETLGEVKSELDRKSGYIRTEVARSICRRKTPTLSFCLVPS